MKMVNKVIIVIIEEDNVEIFVSILYFSDQLCIIFIVIVDFPQKVGQFCVDLLKIFGQNNVEISDESMPRPIIPKKLHQPL